MLNCWLGTVGIDLKISNPGKRIRNRLRFSFCLGIEYFPRFLCDQTGLGKSNFFVWIDLGLRFDWSVGVCFFVFVEILRLDLVAESVVVSEDVDEVRDEEQSSEGTELP